VLDKGQIVEEGTHESLIKNKGIYYEMYQAQNPDAENG
jgi:ATP-binding cassette subfamily B protein